MPWGSPVRAPLATPVALPRAFMPVFSSRIHVQLYTAAYSCTSSDLFPEVWLPVIAEELPPSYHNSNREALKRRATTTFFSHCSCQSSLWWFIEAIFFFWPFGEGELTLSCEKELACSCFASPESTIPALASSLSALSTSGGPLLFLTCWLEGPRQIGAFVPSPSETREMPLRLRLIEFGADVVARGRSSAGGEAGSGCFCEADFGAAGHPPWLEGPRQMDALVPSPYE